MSDMDRMYEESMRMDDARFQQAAHLRTLYDRGAFLFPANRNKGPTRKVIQEIWKEDDTGRLVIDDLSGKPIKLGERVERASWDEIEHHSIHGGKVLYYNPGAQGLLILDFDPMIDEWVDEVSARLGNHPMKVWKSSGALKDPTDDKPGGYGGHAVWKIKGEPTCIRHFSTTDGGFNIGQVFSGHAGYGVIVYDAGALVDAMDADEVEAVDSNLLYSPTGESGVSQRWTEDWKPNPNSRHDSTLSALASAVNRCGSKEEFDMACITIRNRFSDSIGKDRDVSKEWEGMMRKANAFWDKDHTGVLEDFKLGYDWGDVMDKAVIPRAREAVKRIQELADNNEVAAAMEVTKVASKAISGDIRLPDRTAYSQIGAILKAAKFAGCDQDELRKIGGKAAGKWRTRNVVRMLDGDFPVVRQEIRGLYEDANQLRQDVEQMGGLVIDDLDGHLDEDDWMMLMRATGAKLIWSYLDSTFVLQHPDMDEWKEHKVVMPPEYEGLLQLRKGMARSLMRIVPIEQGAGKNKKVWYRAKSVITNEVSGQTINNTFLSNVGTQIKRVDYSQNYTKHIMFVRDNMTDAQRDDCVDLAQNWLLRIPGIAVAPEHLGIAQSVSKLFYALFMHRRLQSFKEHYPTGKPRQQRHMPVLAGEKNVGKTTIAESLLPDQPMFAQRTNSAFSFNSDINEMMRQVRGQFLVNADELNGLKKTTTEAAKQFITLRDGKSHAKFENYKHMMRTDVLIGTTNKSNLPSDDALEDRLLPVILYRNDEGSDQTHSERIRSWFADHHDALMVGGLILALTNADLNPARELNPLRASVLNDLSAKNTNFKDTIERLVKSGTISHNSKSKGELISLRLVCLHAGLLRYTEDVWVPNKPVAIHRKGDVIMPYHGTGEYDSIDDPDDPTKRLFMPANEWGKYVKAAFSDLQNNQSRTGSLTQIRAEVKRLIGRSTDRICLADKIWVEVFGAWGSLEAMWCMDQQ